MSANITAPEWQLLATEEQLQQGLRQAALQNGWRFYHTHNSRRSDVGFPDCVCVRNGRLMFFEIKRQSGRVSMQQELWIVELGQVPGIAAYVVRPEPRCSGEISYDYAIALLAGEMT